MKESTQKVVPASHTLNQRGRKKSINANEVPGSSFVSYDSNSAEDISFLTSSQSTLASDIVNVDEDDDGSSTGSKDVSIPPPYSTSRAVLEELHLLVKGTGHVNGVPTTTVGKRSNFSHAKCVARQGQVRLSV